MLPNLHITPSNQVWDRDITYILVKNGYMFLIAIINLYTRFVVDLSLSNTKEAECCVEMLREDINKYGKSEIPNSDQGSRFTSDLLISFLLGENITISMDGRGQAKDNIFIERLWRSLKYDDIYPKVYEIGSQLYTGIMEYFHFYNKMRRHSSLQYQFPCELFSGSLIYQ